MGVLVLDYDDAVAALPPAECTEAMAEVLTAHARGEAHMPLRSIMAAPGAAGLMGLMPAWRGGHEPVLALKAICLMHQGTPVQVLGKLIAHRQIPKLWHVRSRLVELFEAERGRPPA